MKLTRLSRLTIRARLTLVYGGLFLVAGVLLLGVTYALLAQRIPDPDQRVTFNGGVEAPATPGPGEGPVGGVVESKVVENTWDDALDALLTQGGIALVLAGVAATALGWLIAGRLLQPLQRMTETAARIADAPAADRGLHERIALDGPHDEVKRLADTFDVMLERLDQSFDGQRRFVANASHELRTPLTLNRALLEVAVHRRSASLEVRQLGETLLEINGRHERLLDGLLVLARSEREVVERSYVDLVDIVEHVAEQAKQGQVTILTEAGSAPTAGNSVLLERLVQNLVENGIRYNVPADGWVGITSDTLPDGSAVLVVSNTGPVVPPYEVPRLFEPFHRLDGDRLGSAPGAGLGLSIVRAVARAHGGEATARPRDGGGLVVTVTLPAAPR
ncbi:HAMP domain-containing sensor histidine kinase [Phytohabitans sp. ZYX-F-186]|uniref:histidine kinase n=1 Tax=Phytohabitans maris TaxID=3071409 RepID=A0ABU0ZPL4_9ACTN|nr:HAMP domain-containing sensor histidine kinase [Phytohabitans sp. ZYX-F-186]MDQ7908986.1 HAMP domain-containing sensor histidine kinase [Phytohabitans sp. ZYX-F-186]